MADIFRQTARPIPLDPPVTKAHFILCLIF
jgi:hypothetical protein